MNEPFASESESERELIAFLAGSAKETPLRASATFTDRVLARVALEPRRADSPAYVRAILSADPLPWWVRALAQPASVLAFMLAALAFALRGPLARAPFAASEAIERAIRVLVPAWTRLVDPIARAGQVPGGDLALAVAALPFAVLLAYAGYRAAWSLALPRRAFDPAPARRVGP
jgi:hypothetical protein